MKYSLKKEKYIKMILYINTKKYDSAMVMHLHGT